MLLSFALLFVLGMLLADVCQKLRLPRIVGMLIAGVLLGPCALNKLDDSLLHISTQLRQMALIIVLIRAGLSLDLRDLKRVGRPAALMSFLPACCEIAGVVLLGPPILGISFGEAAIIGAILGAVSPAVVVPKMVYLMEEKLGTDKSIPQLILAGASLDDVFVIVLFTTFVTIEQGGSVNMAAFFNIPVSIVTGIAGGLLIGLLLSVFFRSCRRTENPTDNMQKVLLLLSASFLLVALENLLKQQIAFSGLLGVMSAACMIRFQMPQQTIDTLSGAYARLWIAAEIILFVLVGAAVNVDYALKAGAGVVTLILLALIFRSVGVWLCLIGTDLNVKERLFCVIAYLPKATVQAAIGGVPLALNLPCGEIALTVAVTAILITAPLGALGMDATCKKLLIKSNA